MWLIVQLFSKKLLPCMADEEKDYRAIQSNSSQHVANTFIEVWENIAKECSDGSNHIVAIEYTCSRCNVQCIALPYVNGSAHIIIIK